MGAEVEWRRDATSKLLESHQDHPRVVLVILPVALVALEVIMVVLDVVWVVLGGALTGPYIQCSILACFSSPGHGFARHLVEMRPTDALHLPI